MRRLSVWIDLIGMGQALAGHGPASGPASGARKRSGRTLQRPRPWWSSRNACEQFSAEMLESGQFPSRARSRAHRGVGRSPLVHWRLLTRLLHSPVVVWSWFCDIKITITPLSQDHRRAAPTIPASNVSNHTNIPSGLRLYYHLAPPSPTPTHVCHTLSSSAYASASASASKAAASSGCCSWLKTGSSASEFCRRRATCALSHLFWVCTMRRALT